MDGHRQVAMLVIVLMLGGCANSANRDGGNTEESPSLLSPALPVDANTYPATTAPRLTPEQYAAAVEFAYGSFAVEASSLGLLKDWQGVDHLCFEVGAINTGSRDGSPSSSEFSLVSPSGKVRSVTTFMPPDMNPNGHQGVFPRVVPGAGTSSKLCFTTDGELGQYTLRYQAIGEPQKTWTDTV